MKQKFEHTKALAQTTEIHLGKVLTYESELHIHTNKKFLK